MATTLLSPAASALCSLHNERQRAFYHDPHRYEDHEADPTPQEVDYTAPLPVHFVWNSDSSTGSLLQIADDDGFRHVVYQRHCEGTAADVYNFLPGRRYFWRVNDSACRDFVIADELPRWIYLPRITNVRDIGGWKNPQGQQIRYGMIFRGAEFEEGRYFKGLTDEGRDILLNDLHLKTDMDIRTKIMPDIFPVEQVAHPVFAISAYAGPVKHIQAAAGVVDDGLFSERVMGEVKRCFELFADAESYPLYIHCAGGADRTGSIIFLLEVMLGMDREVVLTDYELSNLSISGERIRSSSVWRKFEKKLMEYGSIEENYYPAVISFLHACGVTDPLMDKIRAILLRG